jgi:prepilin-type N-terminal cleavage/methylation domain-containing protein
MKSPFSVWETLKASKGFTLLEMMLSIGVFLLLVASAFSIVGATTELMTEVSETQERSSLQQRFITVCRNSFEAATSESSLEFKYYDRDGNTQDTYLTLSKAPGAFDLGINREDHITHVVLASEIRSDGLIRSGVYYLNDADYELAKTTGFKDLEASYIELVPRMRQVTWRFYDEQRSEWVPTLDGDFNAYLIELTIQTLEDSQPLRTVFFCLNGA